jgi:hypothetical protein
MHTGLNVLICQLEHIKREYGTFAGDTTGIKHHAPAVHPPCNRTSQSSAEYIE